MPERSILAWLAIGLVVGVIGKFAAPGRDPGGTAAHVLIAVAGALFAGFVAETMRWAPSGAWRNFVAAAIGAVAVLAIYRIVRHRRS
ncbi:MAG: GlsB/YeaQ/YmgE family stress response membrane protein [Proteobacteria bacterium]|nr:GlsB/YeaQ/YmgE family stress response membrane protein [Pseudomonadota bacterium]